MYYNFNGVPIEGSLISVTNHGCYMVYEGFYDGNYFKLEEGDVFLDGDYNLVEYKENDKNILVDDVPDSVLEDLIAFVQDDEVIDRYCKLMYDDDDEFL